MTTKQWNIMNSQARLNTASSVKDMIISVTSAKKIKNANSAKININQKIMNTKSNWIESVM